MKRGWKETSLDERKGKAIEYFKAAWSAHNQAPAPSPSAAPEAVPEVLGYKKLASRFGISRSMSVRIIRDIKAGKDVRRNTKPGPPPLLPHDDELRLVDLVQKVRDAGGTIDVTQLKALASTRAQQLGRAPSSLTKWYECFRKRHPEITRRKVSQHSKSRAAAADPRNLKGFNELYRHLIKELDITNPRQLANFDERGTRTKPRQGGCFTSRQHADILHVPCSQHSGRQRRQERAHHTVSITAPARDDDCVWHGRRRGPSQLLCILGGQVTGPLERGPASG